MPTLGTVVALEATVRGCAVALVLSAAVGRGIT
jgi:hypothetical protein